MADVDVETARVSNLELFFDLVAFLVALLTATIQLELRLTPDVAPGA